MHLLSLAEQYCPRFFKPVFDRVKYSPIGKQVLGGAFWSIFGTGLAKVCTFVAMVLVARILGKEIFGEFGLIRSTAAAFVAFSGMGMGVTATKYIAELKNTDKDRAGRIVGLCYLCTFFASLVVATCFYLAAPWLCESYLKTPHLLPMMRIGAFLLFLLAFMSTQSAIMTGYQDFRGLAMTNLVGGLTMAPLYALGAYFWGLKGAVWAAVFAALLNVAINCFFIYLNNKRYDISYQFAKAYRELSVLWQSNLPIMAASILMGLSVWLGQILLAGRTSTGELGVYYVVLNFQMVMLFIPQRIFPIFLPILSEQNARRDTKRYWQAVKLGWLMNLSVSLVAVLPFLVFPKWFLGLNGQEYVVGWVVLLFACLDVLVKSATMIAGDILLSKGKNYTHLFCTTIAMSAYLAAVFVLLLHDFGAISLFLAMTASHFVYSGLALLLNFGMPNRNVTEFQLI